MWARQLYRKIQMPMKLFMDEAPHVLKTSEGKKIIRNYNKIAKVLLEFEVIYHRQWKRGVEKIKSGLYFFKIMFACFSSCLFSCLLIKFLFFWLLLGLQASILVRHPETGRLYVNFDPEILTLIRETDSMRRLNLEIPLTAVKIQQKEKTLKNYKNKLEVISWDFMIFKNINK